MTTQRDAWQRQPNESSSQFQAFRAYLELGPGRTFSASWREYCKKNGRDPDKKMSSAFRKWKDDNEWDERAKAWDAYHLKSNDVERAIAVKESERILLDHAPDLMQHAVGLALSGDENVGLLKWLLERVMGAQTAPARQGAVHVENMQVNQVVKEAAKSQSFEDLKRLVKEAK